MPAKPANPIDVYVGGRVRMRRIEVDMSQQTLGGHIDLTFKQVQKAYIPSIIVQTWLDAIFFTLFST